MADEKQITTRIPLELHRKVKAKAALEDRTITEVIRELLRDWVSEPPYLAAKYDKDVGWSAVGKAKQVSEDEAN